MKGLIIALALLAAVSSAAQDDSAEYEPPVNPDGYPYLSFGLGLERFDSETFLDDEATGSNSSTALLLYATAVQPIDERLSFVVSVDWLPSMTTADYRYLNTSFRQTTSRVNIRMGLKVFFPKKKKTFFEAPWEYYDD